MARITLPEDFSEFLKLLKSHRVEYLVIGGLALALHGHSRFTYDMDIWVSSTLENSRRLLAALTDFGFPGSSVDPQELVTTQRILRIGHPPLRIEIHNGISGVDFDDCYARKVTDGSVGQEVYLISREDLIKNKRASGRTKDIADAEELERD